MITSMSNPKVKDVSFLQTRTRARQESGLFVVEGLRLVREVPVDIIDRAFYVDNGDEEILSLAAAIGAEEVSENVFHKMSSTLTPQGILAVVRRKTWTLEELESRPGPIIVLEDLQDPGNLGTIIRTGEGAGIAGVIASRHTVDATNPKTARGTMGSIFRVPYYVAEDLVQTLEELKKRGRRLYAAALEGSVPYDEPDYRSSKAAFLIGNEGNGLTDEAIAAADQAIRIPMFGQVESLNAAIAASILMYEALRQNNS